MFGGELRYVRAGSAPVPARSVPGPGRRGACPGEVSGRRIRGRHAPRTPGTTLAPMTKKFEYATVPLLVHATKQILDTWGEDGWELVQVVPGPNNPEQLVAYLKREKA
ncbi:hypothetical protein Snoj_72950 [Streptomyces nojiriensis]|nr:hypothetical protein GCM10010205_55360 [Streptomyces nojiriensis]GHI73377.1 hypothetical protein Snoj_72950 [Streptomyces nojiriensis]